MTTMEGDATDIAMAESLVEEMSPIVRAIFEDPEVDPQKMAVSLAYMVAELVGQVAAADRMPVMERWQRFLAARETAR